LSIVRLRRGKEAAMRQLTSRQEEVLDFIRTFTGRHGVPPTVREIGERFRVTPRAAFDHLRALERKGALQRRPSARRTSRALTLSEPAGAVRYRPVPILGRIAAGRPLLAEENRDGDLPLAPSAVRDADEVFALRVRGQSMIDAHICDGDLVLVRRQEAAQPNDIVVATIDGDGGEAEATVKRFLRDGDRIVLKPENGAMAPIVVDPRHRHVRILGKVIGLLRGF
jgi:repressor LexA